MAGFIKQIVSYKGSFSDFMRTRRLFTTALTIVIVICLVPATSMAAGWYYSYTKAKAAAKKEGKPVLLMIEHEGCPECARMDVAMSNPRAEAALSNAIKCRIEFTNHPELINAFGVTMTPTMIVYSPAHGGEVYRNVGAMSVSGLVRVGKSIDSLVTSPQNDDDQDEPKPKAKGKSSKTYRKVSKTDSDDRPTTSSRNR